MVALHDRYHSGEYIIMLQVHRGQVHKIVISVYNFIIVVLTLVYFNSCLNIHMHGCHKNLVGLNVIVVVCPYFVGTLK